MNNNRELQYDFSGLPDVEVEAKPLIRLDMKDDGRIVLTTNSGHRREYPVEPAPIRDGLRTWITLGILGLVAICMGVMIAIGVGI